MRKFSNISENKTIGRKDKGIKEVMNNLFDDLMSNYELYSIFREDFKDYTDIDLWEDLTEAELLEYIEKPSTTPMDYNKMRDFILEKYEIDIDNTPSAFLDMVYISSKLIYKTNKTFKNINK